MEPSRSGVARGVGGRGTGRDGAYGSEATEAAIWGWVWVVKASERSTLGPSRRGRPRPRRFRAAGEGPLSLSPRPRSPFRTFVTRGSACANCTATSPPAFQFTLRNEGSTCNVERRKYCCHGDEARRHAYVSLFQINRFLQESATVSRHVAAALIIFIFSYLIKTKTMFENLSNRPSN